MARIAILSDIHGNLAAFEAVLADLKKTSPDLVLHGGDLADGGSAPVIIVDRIRELGWQGVLGNTDEMLCRPEALDAFAATRPRLRPLYDTVRAIAAATREELGEQRLAWLSKLPAIQRVQPMTLIHATPESLWHAPGPDTEDELLTETYKSIGSKVVVYGHIHYPFVRPLNGRIVVNSGSVGLPYDGDARAGYVLVDGEVAQIRRVQYDLHREIAALRAKERPGHAWIARMLISARVEMP